MKKKPLPLLLRNTRNLDSITSGDTEENPVDLAVANVPEVKKAHQKVLRLYNHPEWSKLSRKFVVACQDAETEYRHLGERYYFEAGYALGLAAGRVSQRFTPEQRRVAKKVREAVLLGALTPQEELRVLLSVMRAHISRGGNKPVAVTKPSGRIGPNPGD